MVDRCLCYSKSFAELKADAQRHQARSVQALQQVSEFGFRCGLCKPYVARMLESGHTAFAPMALPRHPFEDGDWEEREDVRT